MCGINGIFSFAGKRINPSEVKVMCDCMKHRGPDGEGIYVKNSVGLGHRRLAIIDLSDAGKQPLFNKDKSLVIVFNGEIYNYKDLMQDLLNKGHTFQSSSDTEVILKLYEVYGIKCLDYLRGMFAFAIWDTKKKRLFVARDRLGEKPLLYTTVNNKFYFASEIHALLEGSGCTREINLEALHLYLLYNLHHVPDPYSIIKGIHKLPPAHYMLVNSKGIKLFRYWSLNFQKKSKSSSVELVEEYRQLVKESINLREVSDVPISALLSGGVDSSTIVALMNHKKNLKTFSMGWNKNDSELKRARVVSKIFNTNNKELFFKKNLLKKMPEIIYYYGEPYDIMSALYSYALSEEIHKGFKVTLAGNGADELFYGYDGSNGLLLLSKIEKIFPRFLAKILDFLIPENNSQLKLVMKILSAQRDRQKGDIYRYYGSKLKRNLYKPNALKQLEKFDEGKLIDKVMSECNSKYLIERFYYAGLMLENAHSVTIIADTTGMAHSLEIRAPFLDHKLAEFSAKLPLKMKVRSLFDKTGNKYIMKKSMEGILPNEILYGKKMGFGYNIKLSELIRNEWRDNICRIFEEKLPKLGIFETEYLKRTLDAHLESKEDNSHLIWSLTSFYIWYEIYIKKKDYKKINI